MRPAVAPVDEGVVLQVPGDGLGDPATALLESVTDVVENIRVVGGTAALGEEVVSELTEITGGAEGDVRGDRSHGNVHGVGAITPLPEASEAYADVTGTGTITRTLHGTTEVELQVQGMPADVVAPVHVHVNSCDVSGGDHFQFTPGGSTVPPNEIHPTFMTDSTGVGRGTATAFEVAGPDARSVVVHDPDGNKVPAPTCRA